MNKVVQPKKMQVKKGDTVMVITGKDAGIKGKVLSVEPKSGRVLVEKANMVSRHTKPTKASPQGGIIKQEAGIDSSNVMLFCNRCQKPVRIGKELLANGKRIRKCVKCGEGFDK